MSDVTAIRTEADLEAVVGEPMEFVRTKVRERLDGAMRAFIAQSPLALFASLRGEPDAAAVAATAARLEQSYCDELY